MEVFVIAAKAILGGLAGAISGSENSVKIWRRVWIPFMISGVAWAQYNDIRIFLLMSLAGVMSQGYGIPSIYPPDEGSALGRFWFKLYKNNEKLANIFTRLTIAVSYCIPLLSIVWINHRLEQYVKNSLWFILGYMIINVFENVQGHFVMFNRKLNKAEFFTYFMLTAYYVGFILMEVK
jgi:hypothetical protein